MSRSPVLMLLLLVARSGHGQDETSRTVEGTLTQGDVSMTIVDVFAIVEQKSKDSMELNVYLLPFNFKEEDVKDLQKGDVSEVTTRHGSPDKSKWEKRSPFGRLIIILKPGKEGRAAIVGFTYVTLHLNKYGQTVNRQMSVKEEKLKEWRFAWDDSKASGTLTLHSEESQESSKPENSCSWSIKIACNVVARAK